MPQHPWLKKYPKNIAWDQTFEPWPVWHALRDSAAEFGATNHLDYMGQKTTYDESWERVQRLSAGLKAMGVKKGDKVALFLPNCPQYVWMFFAIMHVGAVVVNLSPLYSARELLHQINDSGTRFLVTADLKIMMRRVRKILPDSQLQKVIVTSLGPYMGWPKRWAFKLAAMKLTERVTFNDTFVDFDDLLAYAPNTNPPEITPDKDLAILQYTGGTTGLPKAAMLSHKNISVNLQQAMAWDMTLERGAGVVLGVLPFFHAFAMTVIVAGATTMGYEIVILSRFEPSDTLKIVEQKHVQMLPAVPTMFQGFLASKRLARTDLSAVVSALSGGAPLPAEVKSAMEKALPNAKIREGYGLTETSPIATANPAVGLQKLNSVGLPMPATEVGFFDLEDPAKQLPYGETGEICIRGPQVMLGYWLRAEATAAAIVDGWLHTGDIGYMDEDGYTFIVDRKKDMILVSGFNVFPRTIEDALYEHPSVHEASVIGIPDAYHGEVPKAFIALYSDRPAVTGEELTAFLRERIGRHEIPKEFEFRAELPKTAVGKLSKKDLVDEERAKRQEKA